MTDEQTAAVMPHAIRLAAAVGHRDDDAAYVAWGNAVVAGQRAGILATAIHPAVAYCLADLVTDAAGATIRAEVRTHADTPATLAALSARGLLP